MAAPTPTTSVWTLQGRTCVSFQAIWANTDNYADQIVVDLSSLTSYTTALRVRKVVMAGSTGIAADLELDAATDVLVASLPLGCTYIEVDFEDHPQGGPTAPSSAVGDLLVTTRSAASGDELFIYAVCDSVAS